MPAKNQAQLLRKMELFADLSDPELVAVGRLLKEQKFAENQPIFAQGDRGDSMYVVTQGRVRIATTDHSGREKVLAFCGAGEFFGEMAVLSGAPRSASARATTPVQALQLRKDDFDRLSESNVGLMQHMLQVMVQRQTAMNTRVSQEASATAGDVNGLVTVVFSPRGGAGKTTLATNLAVALAEASPDRVAILDLDLLFGHVPMLLDLAPRTSLASITPGAIRSLDRESFSYYLAKHAESSLRVLVGTLRPEESEVVTGEHVRAVIDLLRRQFVHVVVDAGSRFSEPCLAAIESAEQLFVVCTPEAVTVRDTRECQRVLRDLLGYPQSQVGYVLNRPLPYASLASDQVASALGVDLLAEVPFGGEDVAKAGLEGLPVVMKRGGNATSKAVRQLARHLDRHAQEVLALR
jgi:CRP-like cAMP-binding protein